MLRWLYDWIHPKPAVVAHSTDETQAQAKAAIVTAQDDLESAQRRAETTRRITRTLATQGDRNHFAELVEASMRSAQ